MAAVADAERARRIPLTGAVNFRDLGGYPVAGGGRTRWGVIYRSDSLADLTEADLRAVAALGLRTLCDFRVAGEKAMKPNRLPEGPLHVMEPAFLPAGVIEMMREVRAGRWGREEIRAEVMRHYRRLPFDHAEAYRAMFGRLLHAEGPPMLIHCTSGKDRTGFGAALILSAAGVARETVVADYALTRQYRRDVSHMLSPEVSAEALDQLTDAPPEYLETALAEIDARAGGIDAYLAEAIGLDRPARARLGEIFVDPPGGRA
jgi:protein-tyrosine phosphatase